MTHSPREIRRIRHEPRLRRLTVRHIQSLTPTMTRIALGGDEVAGFFSPGFDDHIKLFFPDSSGELELPGPDAGPGAPRPLMRDFTPRRFDAQSALLYIDFALHQAGPATQWAREARIGGSLGVGGPRGSTLIPFDYDWHLLIGDETALPAIARRLEELPADAHALVVAEVVDRDHQLTFATGANVGITWIHRNDLPAGSTEPLLCALRALQFPDGDYFAWAAAETSVVRALRKHLIEERKAVKEQLKTAGYWRRGAEGTHEPIQD